MNIYINIILYNDIRFINKLWFCVRLYGFIIINRNRLCLKQELTSQETSHMRYIYNKGEMIKKGPLSRYIKARRYGKTKRRRKGGFNSPFIRCVL